MCALAACAQARPPPAPAEAPAAVLARAERAADLAPQDAALQARAGFLRLLVASDPRGARLRFERALAIVRPPDEGPAAALALAGEAEIADERSDPEALELWARALERVPAGSGQPVAELCAERLLELRGQTRLGDDRILAVARAADAAAASGRGLPARAARLLREAAARIQGERATDAAGLALEAEAWRSLGAIQRWRVAGPFAALRLRDLGTQLALDGSASAAANAMGPAGATHERTLSFPDGDVGLDAEPPEGDLYYAASAVTLPRGGRYLAFVEGAAALELRVDGEVALARSPWPREMPRVQEVALALAPGTHAVLVRWSRAEGARFRVALVRADGGPSDAVSEAPARLTGARTRAPCPLGAACRANGQWDDDGGLRGAAERALARDPADPLQAWLLVRATLGDDRPALRGALEALLAATGASAPALALRAAAVEHDSDVPERLSRSQALADLAEAARKDPLFVRARSSAAELQRESERYQEAGEELDRAEQALRELRGPQPEGAPPAQPPLPDGVVLARARLLDSQGNPAKALALARGVLSRLRARGDGRCDASRLASDLARREGGPKERDELARGLLQCDGGTAVRAGLLRDRGALAPLEELLSFWAAARPSQPARLEQLAEVFVSRGRFADAERALRAASALAPRATDPLRRLAGVFDLAGDRAGSEQARREALLRAPGDLLLRRQLAAARGEELVGWAARDGRAIAREPSPPLAPGEQLPSAIQLLDQGAVQLFDDGGGVERVHSVVRVLDKRGIERYGEVQVPGDAEVLELRTLKRDGRILEPESIPEKETVSLPGLEPGDAVELDFLRGIAPRGPDLPGLSLGAFFFRDEDGPLLETTYEARAPDSAGLEVDAHNLGGAPRIVHVGSETRISFSAHGVRPRLPEPSAPGESETLPWLQVGTGAGQAQMVAQLADWTPLRARPSASIDALARGARREGSRETAIAIYQAVAQAVRGRSTAGDFSTPAAHVLAQGRGNRLLLLRAALASAGIAARIALVRPFGADPAPYRFPRSDLFTGAVLRIELPGGPAWVDPSLRLAPFGRLPAWARGQLAWIVPDPGEAPRLERTPSEGDDGRALSFALRLDADGNAAGTARDVHRGFDAASLKDVLERIDADQRKQAIEAMLGRALRGVALDDLQAEGESAVGGDVALSYALHGGLATRDGGELRLPASTYPARLQRRWLEKAERALPLLVEQPERSDVSSDLTLPPGVHLRDPPAKIALETPFGRYSWEAREEGGVLRVRESLAVPQQRIEPANYAAFGAFVRRVDEAQAQELRLAR